MTQDNSQGPILADDVMTKVLSQLATKTHEYVVEFGISRSEAYGFAEMDIAKFLNISVDELKRNVGRYTRSKRKNNRGIVPAPTRKEKTMPQDESTTPYFVPHGAVSTSNPFINRHIVLSMSNDLRVAKPGDVIEFVCKSPEEARMLKSFSLQVCRKAKWKKHFTIIEGNVLYFYREA